MGRNTYVLVHGSWHGSWCWDKVVSLLQSRGQNAVVLDLPGRAGDPRPPKELTLADFAGKVCQVVGLQAEPVMLVGHSLGGISITQAGETCPEGIKALVYLTAFLLQDGQVVGDVYGPGRGGGTVGQVDVDEEKGVSALKPDAPARDIFYQDCSDADVARAGANLVPEPLAARLSPVHTTPERFGRLRRVYIECLQDNAITLDLQRKMQAAQPCRQVLSLDTGHSPFFCAPEQLVEHLLAAAEA